MHQDLGHERIDCVPRRAAPLSKGSALRSSPRLSTHCAYTSHSSDESRCRCCFQPVALLAIPATLLLICRFLNRRGERIATKSAGGSHARSRPAPRRRAVNKPHSCRPDSRRGASAQVCIPFCRGCSDCRTTIRLAWRQGGCPSRTGPDQRGVRIRKGPIRSAYGVGRRDPGASKTIYMTLAVGVPDSVPRLHDSIHVMRRVLSGAGYAAPAAALHDRALAAWVRAHGTTVTAHDHDELDLLQYRGIRPSQIVFRCGQASDCIDRAVDLGVFRFIVRTEHQIVRLGHCARRTTYLYLDDHSPLVLADQRLKVIGLHGDVADADRAMDWASTTERLLCRTALLKSCGSPIHRIMLSGGSSDLWLDDHGQQLTPIVRAVDEALSEACERWNLSRPAVTLAPSPFPQWRENSCP